MLNTLSLIVSETGNLIGYYFFFDTCDNNHWKTNTKDIICHERNEKSPIFFFFPQHSY